MNIERKRDVYTFTLENGKTVKFDVENKYIIGVSGKKIKTLPQSLRHYEFAKELFDICNDEYDIYANYREIFDRLIVLPKGSIRVREKALKIAHYSDVDKVKKYWNIIIDFIENFDNYIPYVNNWCGIDDLIYIKRALGIAKKYNMKDELYLLILTKSVDFLKDKIFRKSLKDANNNRYEKSHQAICELFGTEDTNILKDRYGIQFKRYEPRLEKEEIIWQYRELKKMLKKLQMNDFIVSNIHKDYAYIYEIYNNKIYEIENQMFKANQTKINLFYEDDTHKIIIPTSRMELDNISKHFHNCANSHEWVHYLSKGRRYLVVVINKLTNEMEVCCDIDSKTLLIQQYLSYCNNSVIDENLNIFKEHYQNYLMTLREE